MGKNISVEVATPMVAVEPSAISDAVSGVNRLLVKKLGLIGGWVTDDETQQAQRAIPILIRPTTDLRYVHYARSMVKGGIQNAPPEIISFITNEDPNYRPIGAIGGDDMPTRIGKRMAGEIGRCTVGEMSHKFDDVKIVDPVKDKEDKHKVVVLTQLTHLTDEQSVTALDIVTDEVNTIMLEGYPEINSMGIEKDAENIGIEKSIPIASVYLHDPSKQSFDIGVLEFVRKQFFAHLIDPTCDFKSGEIDISHES